jgi:hypothetical protein
MGWKSMRHTKPGQWKLRGKKWIMCDCGCCDVFNLKQEYQDYLDKRLLQQVKNAKPSEIADK